MSNPHEAGERLKLMKEIRQLREDSRSLNALADDYWREVKDLRAEVSQLRSQNLQLRSLLFEPLSVREARRRIAEWDATTRRMLNEQFRPPEWTEVEG